MSVKSARYLVGAAVLALSALAVSCSMIEQPAPPLPVATVRLPPNIPHTLDGRVDCRLCHATGIAGAPQFPVATHMGRPSDVCLSCHRPAPGFEPSGVLPWPPETPIPGFPASGGGTASPATPAAGTTPAAVSGKDLFAARCAACHGVNRQGTPGLAPALNPASLTALSDTVIRNTILDGRSGTAMPAFKASLSPEQVDALLEFIKSAAP